MKINLIFFLSEFNLGGAGNSIFKLCKNLPKKKFNINVLCLNKCFYKSELKKCGISVYEIKSNKTIFAMPKIREITKTLINNRYKNIFVSNIYYSNILSILFLRSLNMKMILIERTPFEELFIYYGLIDKLKKMIIKILIRFTFYKADACISNSKFITQKYNKYYNLKFKTIFPPSFKKSNFLFKKNLINKNELKLGIVSRLSKEKKIDNLIKILPSLEGRIILKIIGDGPEKNKLKNLTHKLGLNKQVFFLGAHNPHRIKFFFKDFDIFINSSDFEGFPNSVVESLNSGVPVVASQSHGGINEIIKNKNFGFIYKDLNELKKILDKILKKQKIFNIKKSKVINHLKKFSEENNLKHYKNLFTNI